MLRIKNSFNKLKRPAFIPYLTAGYPDLPVTEKLILELAASGADIIELGVPFSDPVADGPVIQAACQAALAGGVTLKKILELVRRVRLKTEVPLVLMSYFNPILSSGKFFLKNAAAAGVDGLIIPDLPVEEGIDFSRAAAALGIDVIFLAAPTTSPARLKKIISLTRGYLYYVAVSGVTGARQDLPADLIGKLKQLGRLTKIPVAAGFGFSEPAQMKKIKNYADGVIVGSAIIKTIQENIKKSPARLIRATATFCQKLKNALD